MSIHQTALIDPSAQVADSAEIGPHVVIERDCEVGEGAVLMHGVHLFPRTVVGARTRVYPNAVLGGDPQFLGFDTNVNSRVVIGEECELRELVTVHRGLKDGSETRIGNKVMMMTASHVGHDCVVEDNVVIASNSLVAGHVEVGEKAFISGLVAIHQYVRIGKLAMVGGQCGPNQDIAPYMMAQGASPNVRVVNLNVIGLRRAGVGPEARQALKRAFRELFRSGHSLPKAIENIRAEWDGKEMPAELTHLVEFVAAKSKRGITGGSVPRPGEDGEQGTE